MDKIITHKRQVLCLFYALHNVWVTRFETIAYINHKWYFKHKARVFSGSVPCKIPNIIDFITVVAKIKNYRFIIRKSRENLAYDIVIIRNRIDIMRAGFGLFGAYICTLVCATIKFISPFCCKSSTLKSAKSAL